MGSDMRATNITKEKGTDMSAMEAPRIGSMSELLQDLKKVILEMLEDTRNLGNRVGDNKAASGFVNGRTDVLTKLNRFVDNAIKQGVIDMKELKVEVGETGSLDELLENERGGIIEPAIKEIAKRLKPGSFERMDNREDVLKGIQWGHFAGRIYRMMDDDKLPDDYGPMRRKTKFYLVRYTAEMMSEIRARRAAAKKTGAKQTV